MHPELLSALATERRRDLDGALTARVSRGGAARRAGALIRPVSLPKFRVSWTHASLAAVADGRRGNSVVIVISATRAS